MVKKLSHDQKRKAKLKKRAERSRQHESLAYRGEKYRADKYAPMFFATERGIFESHVLLERALTDDDVEQALETLVIQLRGDLFPYPTEEEAYELPDDFVGVIIASIRRNWLDLIEGDRKPGRDDLIGVLRTLLSSIEFRRAPERGSLGYLNYLEKFLAKMGVSVRLEKGGAEPPPELPDETPKALDSDSDSESASESD